MPERYRHVFVEPHFDDVALSCGGSVQVFAARGEPVLVVTLFAGDPGRAAVVTEFAAGQHARWGAADDPIAQRRAEQQAALDLLGADWLPMPWLDAIYRGEQYRSDDELFGVVKPGDAKLVDEIAARLSDLARLHPEAIWRAPMAVGNHVDHQIALRASAALPGLLLYEDFPYVAREPDALAKRVAELGAHEGPIVSLAADLLERKVEAIARYRSQIATLFGDGAAMEQAVRAYFASGERYWVA
ncbi:MAG TPA: PIG-L family deacetylase [Chloroflexota bacterium]|nr:PIG-L family deacetylase [Chloroflexota bacterium]